MTSAKENTISQQEKEPLSDPASVEITDWVDRARRTRSYLNEERFSSLIISVTLLEPIREAMGGSYSLENIVGFIALNSLEDYPMMNGRFDSVAAFLNANTHTNTDRRESEAIASTLPEEKVSLMSKLRAALSLQRMPPIDRENIQDESNNSLILPIPETGIAYLITNTQVDGKYSPGSVKAMSAKGRGITLIKMNLEDLSPESRTGMSFLKNPKHAPNDSVEK